MKKKSSIVTCVMLHQKLNTDYWDNQWNKEIIVSHNVLSILKEIVSRVSTITEVIAAYAINHDKDTHKNYNFEKKKYQTVTIDPHITVVLKFKKGVEFDSLADMIGIPSNHIEKAASGRYSFDNFLAYLIHAKDQDKFQYDPSEVVTLIGTDYNQIYQSRHGSWEHGRVAKNEILNDQRIKILEEAILQGKITKVDILKNPKHHSLYAQHKTKINELFETRAEIKNVNAKLDLINRKFKKTIIYVQGDTGTGKTTMMQQLIFKIIENSKKNGQNWEYKLTAGTNAIDGYLAEEILFLDDTKGYSLTSSDWLKLLDPYNFSPISARYANRDVTARVIIITNTLSPIEFFQQTKHNEIEDIAQYIRRIDCLITISPLINSSSYIVESPEQILVNVDNMVKKTYQFSNPTPINDKNLLFHYLLTIITKNNNWSKGLKLQEKEETK